MVKKYHQTRLDRLHESEGMKRYEHGKMKKYHQTAEDRRHESEGMRRYYREKKESLDDRFMGMISEDHSCPSNLPQHVVHKYYPQNEYMDRYELDDTIEGIDDNINDSIHEIEHNPSESMY